MKTDRQPRDLQAEEGAGIHLKDLPGSLGKEHIIQNRRKNGVLYLCLLIKRKPYQRRGCLGLQHHLTVLPWLCSSSSICLARRMLWVNHFRKLWNMCHLNILTALAGPSHVCALTQDPGTWFEVHTFLLFCTSAAFPKDKSWSKGHPALTHSGSWGRAISELGRG